MRGYRGVTSIHLTVTGNVDSATVLLGGLPADEVTSSGTSGSDWTGMLGVYGWTASLDWTVRPPARRKWIYPPP